MGVFIELIIGKINKNYSHILIDYLQTKKIEIQTFISFRYDPDIYKIIYDPSKNKFGLENIKPGVNDDNPEDIIDFINEEVSFI